MAGGAGACLVFRFRNCRFACDRHQRHQKHRSLMGVTERLNVTFTHFTLLVGFITFPSTFFDSMSMKIFFIVVLLSFSGGASAGVSPELSVRCIFRFLCCLLSKHSCEDLFGWFAQYLTTPMLFCIGCIQLTVKDGTFPNLKDGLAPRLSLAGDVAGVEMGADVDVGLDVMSAPKSIWWQKSTDVSGWTLKARAEYSEGKYDYPEGGRGVYLSLEANDEDETFFGWISGDICKSGPQPLKVGGKKIFTSDKGKFMLEPRYRFYEGSTPKGPDICLGYEPSENTRVYLTASMKDQNVKVVQAVDEENTVSVKASVGSGFQYAKVENNSDLGKSTITVTKDDLDLQLSQNGWTAGMKLGYPYHKSEPQVRFSKKFSIGADV